MAATAERARATPCTERAGTPGDVGANRPGVRRGESRAAQRPVQGRMS